MFEASGGAPRRTPPASAAIGLIAKAYGIRSPITPMSLAVGCWSPTALVLQTSLSCQASREWRSLAVG